MALIMGDPSSNGTGAYASASYVAVSADTGTPVATDTTLTGEVSSGSLARAQGVFAHTTGTNTYTLTKTLTSDQNIVLAKAAVFNAASSGTMLFEGLLGAVATMQVGDQVQITCVVTL